MSAADPYFDAEHGLLWNRLGIVDPGELEQVEAELAALRLVEALRPPPAVCRGRPFGAAHADDPARSPLTDSDRESKRSWMTAAQRRRVRKTCSSDTRLWERRLSCLHASCTITLPHELSEELTESGECHGR